MKYGILNLGQIEAIVNKLGGMDGVAKFLSGELIVGVGTSAYTVVVDYTRTLGEMITAGRYDWTNSDITADHFPISGTGKVTVGLELVHLDRVASTSEVLRTLEERGLRPATLVELLAFGEKYPEEQRQYPIVALGSFWQDPSGRSVPYLYRFDAMRDLNLNWNDDDWFEVCRFLAVRK